MTGSKSQTRPWASVYKKDMQGNQRYRPLFDAADIATRRYVFDDRTVEDSQDLMVRDCIKIAAVSDKNVFSAAGGEAPLTLDFQGDDVRFRPLDYRFYYRFHRTLDHAVAVGSRNFKTLRMQLSPNGQMHQIDSDVAPTKVGMTGLIVSPKTGEVVMAMQGLRSKKVTFYPNTLHSSFSGGVEVQDLDAGGGIVADCIKATAVRECKEELDLEIGPDQVDVLGIWRDAERLNAQSFVVVRMDDLGGLKIKLNAEAVWMKPMKPGYVPWFMRLLGKSASPELAFFWHLLLPKSPV